MKERAKEGKKIYLEAKAYMSVTKNLLKQLVTADDSVEINTNINQVACRDAPRTILALRNNGMLSETRFLRSLDSIDRNNCK